MLSTYFFCLLTIHYGILSFRTCAGNPIIGETYPATKGEFPFIVYLSHYTSPLSKKSYICGGALISRKHVLTSKHCIEKHDRSCVVVVVNAIDFNNGMVYRIDSWLTYDIWAILKNVTRIYSDNDIAIVRLSRKVKSIKPGVISQLHDEELIGKKVVTAGWGVIDRANQLDPDSLRKAYMKILDRDTYVRNIKELYGQDRSPVPNYYYTSGRALLCRGDSGSPLLLSDSKEIVGINDSGCAVDDPRAMSRHLKVDYYRDFINYFAEES